MFLSEFAILSWYIREPIYIEFYDFLALVYLTYLTYLTYLIYLTYLTYLTWILRHVMLRNQTLNAFNQHLK